MPMRPAINAMVSQATLTLVVWPARMRYSKTFVVSTAPDNASTCWVRPVMGWWSPTSAPVTNWLDQRVTSFAWLMFNAICRDGGILWRWTNGLPWSSARVVIQSVFRTQHSYEAEQLVEPLWFRRMQRLRQKYPVLLTKGCEVPADVTPDAASIFSSMKPGCGCFTVPGTPLTNNEAERCIRAA